LVQHQQKGRICIAKKNISPNSIVLNEIPLVLYPDQQNMFGSCHYCGRPREKNLQDSVKATFCNSSCEQKATFYRIEKQLFPAINQAAMHGIIYLTWLMMRTVSHLLEVPTDIPLFASMHKGAELIGEEKQAVELAYQLISEHIPKELKSAYLKLEQVLGPNLSQIKRIIDTNAFVLRDEEPFPFGLFPTTALYSHSCQPNLTYHYNPETRSLQVSTLSPIAKGQEMTVTYFPTKGNFVERQRELALKRNFVCQCALCCSEAPKFCAQCGKQENLKVCAKCKFLRYCSRECQVLSWKEHHKQLCPFVKL